MLITGTRGGWLAAAVVVMLGRGKRLAGRLGRGVMVRWGEPSRWFNSSLLVMAALCTNITFIM